MESSAWYVDPMSDIQRPYETDEGFTGSVAEGGSVNFRNIAFNPHGNGTHTECLGHITEHVLFREQGLVTRLFYPGPTDQCSHPDRRFERSGFFTSEDDRILHIDEDQSGTMPRFPKPEAMS